MLRRGLGWVNDFITQWVQPRTRQDYDYRVSTDRTGATLSMRFPLGKYTAVGEAVAESSLPKGATGGGYFAFEKCFNVSYWRHSRGRG